MKTRRKIKYICKSTKTKVRIYLKKIWEIILKPEMSVIPGQLAFFMILSLVPIITLCGVAASSFGIGMDFIIENIGSVIPGGIEQIKPYLIGSNIDFKLSLILIWMFYIASGGCNSIILISNQIYGINQSNWLKRRIKAIIMTLSIVLFLLLLLIFPVFGEKIITIFPILYKNKYITSILKILKGPLSWLIIFIFVRSLYEFAPDRVRKNSHINIGAFVTTIGWMIVTSIYKYLAHNMSTYNIFYGALSNIAILMMWIYFMSFVMVIGMTLNYGEEHSKEELEKTGAIKIIKTK